MNRLRPVGVLMPGSYFRTSLTERLGVVLAHDHSHDGVPVALENPVEEKRLHDDVRVAPELEAGP